MTIYHRGTIKGICSLQIQALLQTKMQKVIQRATQRRRRRNKRNIRTLLLEKCGVPPRVLELEDSTLMLVETQLHPERLLIAQYVKYTAKDIIFSQTTTTTTIAGFFNKLLLLALW